MKQRHQTSERLLRVTGAPLGRAEHQRGEVTHSPVRPIEQRSRQRRRAVALPTLEGVPCSQHVDVADERVTPKAISDGPEVALERVPLHR